MQDRRLATDATVTTMSEEKLASRRRRTKAAPKDGSPDAQIIALAKKRFRTAADAESRLRVDMLDDKSFRSGLQWPDQVLTDRTLDKRPTLTINRLPQFIKQITNPQRQSRPSVQVNPVGDGADVDTAEVIQGLIRHIESTSHAEVAFDHAFEDAVTMGRGWFRILTEFVDDGQTFDQEIVVKRVSNAFTVYADPSCQELDYSDARFMFVVEDVPKDEYITLYGDESYASLELFRSVGDKSADWYPEGKVRIAEYWYVEEIDSTIALLPSSEPNHPDLTVPLEQVPESRKKDIKAKRKITSRKVHWVKMNASTILSKQVWPGKWIPIVPVLGDEINIDGRKDLVGVVRYARDPQRMYNYWNSAMTETIALAPRAPFIGAAGQFKGHEDQWKLANTRNFAYLEYEDVGSTGRPIPPPQRQVFEPPVRAIVEAVKQSDNDLKAVTGFYDASLGQPGPDQSGKAILARQRQGETGNINFIDNLGRALWHYGRICLDLIPKIYDTPRVLHIMGVDDQLKQVQINQAFMAPQGMPPGVATINQNIVDEQNAVKKIYDVTVGRYNVTLSIGPNWQSRRQEAVESMLQLAQAVPNIMPVIGDLLVGEMDWPKAKAIAERLKKMLPPGLQDTPDQLPPQAQAQIQALMQQHELVVRALSEAQDTIKSKKLELASREYIAAMQNRTQLAIALEKVNAEMAQTRLEQEIQSTTQLMQANHERLMDELGDVREAALGLHAQSVPPNPAANPPDGGEGGGNDDTSGGSTPAPAAPPNPGQ